jgi:hypothetical protein
MTNATAHTLQTLLATLHRTASLWAITDGRRTWGKGFARFNRSVSGEHSAMLHGVAESSASAHTQMAAAQRKVEALELFSTVATVLDSLPCYKGVAFAVETASPTTSGKSPTFTCHVDGLSLGDTTTKQTAASLVRKLMAVATFLDPLDWHAPQRGWATLDGGAKGRDPLLAPNLESAQIKMLAIQRAGQRPDTFVDAGFAPLAEVHPLNLARREVLLDLIRKAQP